MTGPGPKRRNLGRGLDALLGSDPIPTATPPTDTSREPDALLPSGPAEPPARPPTAEHPEAGPGSAGGPGPHVGRDDRTTLPVDKIRSSRFQPRRNFDREELDALTQSIREVGLIQPVLVRPHPDHPDFYELIAGERRWLAAQGARLHEIPVVIRDVSDRAALEFALVENVQRQDLTPVEEAEGYRRLMEDFGHTQEDLARVVGKSRSHVANMMRLLSLPESVKDMLERRELTAGHARTLLGALDPEGLAREIVAKRMSVREAERLARLERRGDTAPRGRPGPRGPAEPKSPDIIALENELSAALGLKVDITHGPDGGEFVIRYSTLEQLDDILGRLGNKPS